MSHIDNLLEFAEHNADDWNWPIGVVAGAKAELAALRARLALADDLRVCGARWLAAHADATVLDNSGDYRESGKAFERAIKRFSGSEALTDPACAVMSCDLSVVFACGICSAALCETHHCLDKRCVEILALRARVAELDKTTADVTEMAVRLAGSTACEKHNAIIRATPFGAFAEQEHAAGCQWCARDRVAALEKAVALAKRWHSTVVDEYALTIRHMTKPGKAQDECVAHLLSSKELFDADMADLISDSRAARESSQ